MSKRVCAGVAQQQLAAAALQNTELALISGLGARVGTGRGDWPVLAQEITRLGVRAGGDGPAPGNNSLSPSLCRGRAAYLIFPSVKVVHGQT